MRVMISRSLKKEISSHCWSLITVMLIFLGRERYVLFFGLEKLQYCTLTCELSVKLVPFLQFGPSSIKFESKRSN